MSEPLTTEQVRVLCVQRKLKHDAYIREEPGMFWMPIAASPFARYTSKPPRIALASAIGVALFLLLVIALRVGR